MAKRISPRLTVKEGRDFAFAVGGAFALLAAIAYWRHHPVSWRVFGAVASPLLVAGVAVPDRLGSVQRAWMAFGHVLSRITTPIFMGAIYFLVLTPMGLAMRLSGRNPVRHEADEGSFWFTPASGGASNMKRQF